MELSTPPLIATAMVVAAVMDFAADWGATARSESGGVVVSWRKGAQAGVPVPLEGDTAAIVGEFAIVVVGGFRKVALIGRSPLWLNAGRGREGDLQPLGLQRSRSRFPRWRFDGPS